MIDLLKTLIDWEAQPRRAVETGTAIIASGEPTGLIFCLEARCEESVEHLRDLVPVLILTIELLERCERVESERHGREIEGAVRPLDIRLARDRRRSRRRAHDGGR